MIDTTGHTMRFILAALLFVTPFEALAAKPKAAPSKAEQRTDLSLRMAQDLYNSGKYADAIAIWRPLASAGEVNALFNLGQVYRLGRGVSEDKATAMKFYQLASDAGHIQAMTHFAAMLYFSEAPLRDRTRALALFETAARKGSPEAQYMFGGILFNGDGVPRDRINGFAWIYLSASGGHKDAVEAADKVRRVMPPADLANAEALAATLREVVRGGGGRTVATRVIPQKAPTPRPAPPLRKEPEQKAPAPAPAYTPVQPAEVAEGEGFWLQMASARDESGVAKLTAGLAGRFKPVLGTMGSRTKVAPTDDGGAWHKIQFGPYASRTDAIAACAAIKSAGGSCYVTQ